MEVAGVVFRQSPCFSSTAGDVSISRQSIVKPTSIRVKARKWVGGLVVSGEYSDKGHLQYYEGIKKKEVKKKLKLLKGLSKNLNTFTEMGFCLDPDNGLDQQVKGKMISVWTFFYVCLIDWLVLQVYRLITTRGELNLSDIQILKFWSWI